MKKHNKFIAGIMAVCLMRCMPVVYENISPVVSMAESSEENYTYENLTYTFSVDGTIEITGCDKSATEVTIPSKIDNVKVTSIGDYAFTGCYNLTSINIPDSLINININGAFLYCNLASINVSENHKYYSTIDGVLFNKDKTKLIKYPYGKDNKEYVIPNNVESICEEAFSDSTLTSITIPDSVKNIDRGAFSFCRNLKSITIPYSVTEIESSIFSWSTVNSVTVLNPECNIDDYGFSIDVGAVGMNFINTICGYDNSTAQAYAEQHGCNFVSLGKAPEKETISGDMNGDNEFNISDVVLFQKYILGGLDTEISDWKQADLNSDGLLDVFDLVMMRKKLIEK